MENDDKMTLFESENGRVANDHDCGSKHDTSQFEKDLAALGVKLTEEQIQQFLIYYEMLVEWNQKMNLTAITEYDEVMKKHFIDSISLVKAYDVRICNEKICDDKTNDVFKDKKLIDVGTGAGFPGLALKIAYPNLQVTLLDSLNKRIQFLDAVIDRLKLQGVETIHGRAEDFAKPNQLREQFDLCVSRAVANLSTLSEYCLPFVKMGGQFISYKSERSSEEMEAAGKAISILGGRVAKQVEFYLPDSDIYRNLFVIDKIQETPKKFPRKAGLPGKEPIK